MRLLLVEDDSLLGQALQQTLWDAAFAVDWVRDGEAALHAATAESYDLVLLDLRLPGKDGLTVLATLRCQLPSLPVIIITARDTVEDRISGLDAGADDYLVKPFAVSELLARIRAVSRRHQQGNAQPVLSNGCVGLDPVTRQALRDDQAIPLTAREYALLHALLVKPGAIKSRSELESHIYGWNEEVESNAVEFLIHSLRKKLGADIIKNVRGLGWMTVKSP